MSQNFLSFDKKQASYISGGILLLALCSFVIGYIVGQKTSLSRLNEDINKANFEDQVKYSLYSSYKSMPDQGDFAEENLASPEEIENNETTLNTEPQKNIPIIVEEELPSDDKTYYAVLFGCGTLGTAQKFTQRMKKIGFDIEIKRRRSKNSKGKFVTWYQLLTAPYKNKKDLLADVEKIQLAEKLQKVQILETTTKKD